MRFTPVSLALSLSFALTASVLYSAPATPLDPRAVALMNEGRAALASGNADAATDSFEAALAVNPGNVGIMLALAEASRKQGMQGKAIHYYRQALVIDPQNLDAMAGEGAALVERGAIEKAKRDLARLEGMCGSSCAQAKLLADAIAKGPAPKVVTAEDVKPQPTVSAN